MEANIIYNIDCLTGLRNLPDDSIDCCVTSPPYFNLRDYGVSGQIGLEDTPEQYIQKLVGVFHEVRRVLAPAGTLWVNIGDCYAGSGKGAANYPDNAMKYKQGTNRGTVGRSAIVKKFDGYKSKDLIGIPWMLAFALRADGVGIQRLEFVNGKLGLPRIGIVYQRKNEIALNDGLSFEDWENWFKNYDLAQPMAIIHFTKFRY